MPAERLVTLYELLGMSEADGERLMKEVGEMFDASEDPPELCKMFVDKYGIDAVFSSICLRMLLEQLSMVDVSKGMAFQCPSRN